MPKKFTIGLGTSIVTGLVPGQQPDKVGAPAGLSKRIISMDSTSAFHSTLFEDFAITATPVYNFYTHDELTTFVSDPSASLDDLPRYVNLTWNVTPQIRQITTKGLHPTDPRKNVVKPVVPFEVARSSTANGYVSPGTVSALLVDPVKTPQASTFSEDLFLQSSSGAGKSAASVSVVGSDFHIASPDLIATRTQVNFLDPSIAGAVDANRISVSSDQVHLATLGSFSKLLPGLEVISEFNQDVPIRNPPPKFTAPPDAPTLAYVGYVIERYTLDAAGSMTLSKTISIGNPKQGSFIDREVVFNGTYSYRIKAIVQWTHPANVDFAGTSNLDRLPAFDNTLLMQSKEASFYSGQWSNWSKAFIADTMAPLPPDELTIRPSSLRGVIYVCWKLPWNPQRDLATIRILRSTMSGGRFTNWKQIAEFPAGNGQFVDHDVENFELESLSYAYSAYCTSYHGEHSPLCEVIQAELTDRSDIMGEQPVALVSEAGGDPFSHPVGFPVKPDLELIVRKEASIYLRGGKSTIPLFGRQYVVEVQSLDTGERVNIPLSATTTTVGVGSKSLQVPLHLSKTQVRSS